MDSPVIRTSPRAAAIAIKTSGGRPNPLFETPYFHRPLSAYVPPLFNDPQNDVALTRLSHTAEFAQRAAQQGLHIQELVPFRAKGLDGAGRPSASPWVGLKVFALPAPCSVFQAPLLSSSFRLSTVDRFCAYVHRTNGTGMKKVPLRRAINLALSGAAPYRKQVLRGHPIEVGAQISLLPPPQEVYSFSPQVHRTEHDVPKMYILCSILGSAAMVCTGAGTINLPYHTGINFSKFVVLPQTANRITLAGEALATSAVSPLGGSSLIVVEVPVLRATAVNRELDTGKPLRVMIQGYHASAHASLSADSARTVRHLFEELKRVMTLTGTTEEGQSDTFNLLPFWANNLKHESQQSFFGR